MNRTRGVNELRLALFAPTPARFSFRVALPDRPVLTFGAGVPLNSAPGPVTVSVWITQPGRAATRVDTLTIQPLGRGTWRDRRVDLGPWSGKEVQLSLRAEGPRGGLAFLSNPTLWKRGARSPGLNVVFILVDTLRADAAHVQAAGRSLTPTLDGLARSGVAFDRCISLASWTRSSLLSMFTGQWISRLEPRLNTSFYLPRRLRARMYRRWPRLLTRHLRRAGYWVEAIGNNFFLPGFTPIGFDRAYDRVTDIRDSLRDTPAVTRGAVRFLRQHADKPFFLYLHYDGPHAPYVVPPGYRVRGARAPGAPHDRLWERYLGKVRFTDEHLAPLLAALGRLGLRKRTLVVLTADHGEVFSRAHDVIYKKDHRTLHHHGWSVFREVLHVPLVLSLPGTLPAGRRVSARVSHMDLVPTLLDLVGVKPMAGHLGRSLADALRRGAPVRPSPDVASMGRNLFSLFSGRYHLIWRQHRTQKYRRPHARDPGEVFYRRQDLYDLQADPGEVHNIAREHPALVARLRAALRALVLPAPSPPQAARGPAPSSAGAAAAAARGDLFARQGLRLGLRLAGGAGAHRLDGTFSCTGTVVVRALRGPAAHAASRAPGHVTVRLESRAGRPTEVALELVGCPAQRLRFHLRLDGQPVTARQLLAGPIGLALLERPDRLPPARLAGLLSRRPPPALGASPTPHVHLWLGSPGSADALDLEPDQGSAAAHLADQMLRNAGYAKGPAHRPAKAPMSTADPPTR